MFLQYVCVKYVFIYTVLLEERLELDKVGHTQTSRSIPSLNSRESGRGRANVISSLGNITEAILALLVEPRVEETKRALAIGHKVVVEKSNDGGGSGGGSAGATASTLIAAAEDGELGVERSDIRVGTTRSVERALGRAAQLINVCLDSVSLVVGNTKVVGEATAAVAETLLVRTVAGSATDCGDPGAAGRERRLVGDRVTLASGAASGARVTRSGENTNTASAQLQELRANSVGVVCGNSGLIITIRNGVSLEGLSKARVYLSQSRYGSFCSPPGPLVGGLPPVE